MSAQTLEASLFGVLTMLSLERGARSMAKGERQATKEYAPPTLPSPPPPTRTSITRAGSSYSLMRPIPGLLASLSSQITRLQQDVNIKLVHSIVVRFCSRHELSLEFP